MRQLIETPDVRETLMFEQKRPHISAPIRMAMLDGVPHFSLKDLAEAMGWRGRAIEAAYALTHPIDAKRIVDETTDGEPTNGIYLSPVGCWTWTHAVAPEVGQHLAAWAQRVAREWCPNPRPNDPAIFLTRRGDEMPPMPFKFSGRRTEWFALKECPVYLYTRYGIRVGGRVPIECQMEGAN